MATIAEQTDQTRTPPSTYVRFSPAQRFEHMVLLVTFTGLALTGLPQTFAQVEWVRDLIGLMGGIESIRIIHRILAVILMVECIYHGGILSYKAFVLGREAVMMPSFKDIRDAFDWVMFNLGFKQEHPHMPRYNFGEKAEYLAVVWGTVLMVVTGFMMWNPIAVASVLPGEVIPAARAAHSAEAVLAVLSIIVWHLWHVRIRRVNNSMFTGRLHRDVMEVEHAAELRDIENGIDYNRNSPEVVKQRTPFFMGFAILMTTALVSGLIWFVTLETSAITTLPERSTAFTTDIDTSIGDAELGLSLWDAQGCVACHGASADAAELAVGVSIVERELTVERFIIAIRLGPAEMPAYPVGTLSDEDIAHLWAWFQSLES